MSNVKSVVNSRVKDIAKNFGATMDSVKDAVLYWALTCDEFSADAVSEDFVAAMPRGRKAMAELSVEQLEAQALKLQAMIDAKRAA